MSVKEVMTSLADAVRGRYSVTNKLTVADMTDLINSENIDVAKLIDRSITKIEIPEGVTEIGKDAFRGCSQLTEVTLPSTITSIGENAFADCPNLTIIDCSFNDDSVLGAPWGVDEVSVIISYNNSPLTFIAAEANSSVSLNIQFGNPTVSGLQYRTDVRSDWSYYPIGHTIQLDTVDSYVQFRNTNDDLNHFNDYSVFNMTGSIKATGSVQSLLNGSHECKPSCFERLFMGCDSLLTAPKLTATTLAYSCYMDMFISCSIKEAPKLPATKLETYCYRDMFTACSHLIKAPELPATSLAEYCHSGMFSQCTSLITAPKLPATTLASHCYNDMFWDCTKLTTAPSLPSLTLKAKCYTHMFQGCTSLTAAPELPATTLGEYCYEAMFYGCTSLITAPELPATTLTTACYRSMFYGCTSLKSIRVAFTEWKELCTDDWMFDILTSGSFYKPSALPEEHGIDRIPTNWTVVNKD